MWRKARAGGLVAGLVAALLLLGVGPAAAAPELMVSPDSGPPGSTFLVTGTGFAPSEVVIRWGGEAGDELARATGPDFTVEVAVPADAPPDSYAVMAVVTDGGSVSTSSESFQVTGPQPAEPAPTTTTPVEEPPVTTTPTTAPAPSAPSAAGGGLSRADSVGGGVEGGMADTTNGSEGAADPAGALLGGRAGSATGETDAGAGSAGVTTTTTAPGAGAGAPAGAPGAPPPGPVDGAGPLVTGDDRAGAPGPGAGEASGSALGPRPASQSSGAVRSPLLLLVGLGMVFAAGVILAVRNRQRVAGPPGQPAQPLE